MREGKIFQVLQKYTLLRGVLHHDGVVVIYLRQLVSWGLHVYIRFAVDSQLMPGLNMGSKNTLQHVAAVDRPIPQSIDSTLVGSDCVLISSRYAFGSFNNPLWL